MVQGNFIDVESFSSKLSKRVEEDRGDELRLSELVRDHLESGVAPLLDELPSLLLVNPVFPSEPRDRDVGPFGGVLADPPEAFRSNADRWHLRRRIHACPSRKRSAVRRPPVAPRVASPCRRAWGSRVRRDPL